VVDVRDDRHVADVVPGTHGGVHDRGPPGD
jgi:hypothetical protein